MAARERLKKIFDPIRIRRLNRSKLVTGAIILGVGGILWLFSNQPEEIEFERYERSIYSQNGEDGVLQKIFEIIPPTHKYAVEFGAGDGIRFSNVRHLYVDKGWSGLLIEGDETLAQAMKHNYRDHPDVKCLQAWVYPGNIELLFEENDVPRDFDLLVIDIDSNDWYVWRAIRDFRPKVVQIEYNGYFMPPTKMVIDFHPMNYYDRSFYYGASIQSLYELGKKKGYELIYAEQNGVNSFFVDRKYFKRFGIEDNSPQTIYRKHMGKVGFTYEQITRRFVREDGSLRRRYDKDLVWDEVRIKKRLRFDR